MLPKVGDRFVYHFAKTRVEISRIMKGGYWVANLDAGHSTFYTKSQWNATAKHITRDTVAKRYL